MQHNINIFQNKFGNSAFMLIVHKILCLPAGLQGYAASHSFCKEECRRTPKQAAPLMSGHNQYT